MSTILGELQKQIENRSHLIKESLGKISQISQNKEFSEAIKTIWTNLISSISKESTFTSDLKGIISEITNSADKEIVETKIMKNNLK